MPDYPVLDIGGSHVTAALVDPATWQPNPHSRHRQPLRSDGSASAIIATITECANTLGPLKGTTLAVAIPGPFDYKAGIGRFAGVEKFESLNGVDVRSRLLDAFDNPPSAIVFLHDAAAFGIGEWVSGAASRHDEKPHKLVAITLGTGVGSAFIDAGKPVTQGPQVPPEGYAHLLRINGRPLEDVMSTRAIIASYTARVEVTEPSPGIDVQYIARRATTGDTAAIHAIADAARALGTALGPWLAKFEADTLVVGGGIAQAWPLVGPALRAGIRDAAPRLDRMTITPSLDPEAATEIGAAWFAHQQRRQ